MPCSLCQLSTHMSTVCWDSTAIKILLWILLSAGREQEENTKSPAEERKGWKKCIQSFTGSHKAAVKDCRARSAIAFSQGSPHSGVHRSFGMLKRCGSISLALPPLPIPCKHYPNVAVKVSPVQLLNF